MADHTFADVVEENDPSSHPDTHSTDNTYEEDDVQRLQIAISKCRNENASDNNLLNEVETKMSVLWKAIKDNLGNRKRIQQLEKENLSLKKKNNLMKLHSQQISKICIEFKRQRDFHYRKWKICSKTVAELDEKCDEQQKFLNEAEKEIDRLNKLMSCMKKTMTNQSRGDPTKLRGANQMEMDTESLVCEVECGDQEDLSSQMNEDMYQDVGFDDHDESTDDGKRRSVRLRNSKSPRNRSSSAKKHNDGSSENPDTSDEEISTPSENDDSDECRRYRNAAQRKLRQYKRLKALADKEPKKPREKKYECTFNECGQKFAYKESLRRHIMSHTGERPFECNFESCGKRFASKAILQRHFLTHTGEKPFKCAYEGCGQGFARKADLKLHYMKHAGRRQFACEVEGCDQKFFQKYQLKRHLLVHTDERPFKCSFEGCTKSFTQGSNLKQHVLTHTGEKPFKCLVDGCNEWFSHRGTMKKHALTHGEVCGDVSATEFSSVSTDTVEPCTSEMAEKMDM